MNKKGLSINKIFAVVSCLLIVQWIWAEPIQIAGNDTIGDEQVDGEGDELGALDDIDDAELVPAWIQTYMVGDTLHIPVEKERLPRHIVVATTNGECYYRLQPMDRETLKEHPADSAYRHIWTSARVNPYSIPVDSIQDSITIDLKGFCLPHKGYVTSPFGWRRYRFHYGTDIKVQVGDTLRSSWDGQVRIVGWDPQGYGYFVVVRHNNGLETVYGHMSMPMCEENEAVHAGDLIGLGGNTGRSTGSHLHYEIRYLGHAINPASVVDFSKGELINADSLLLTRKMLTNKNTVNTSSNSKTSSSSSRQYYTVKSGDMLGTIARKYHTTVNALCKLNGIKSSSILRIGQKLRVR